MMLCRQLLTRLSQFNIVVDDTDALLDDLREWKRPGLSDNKPPPLIVEVYLDTAHLRENQALVIVDESGKRWDVSDALAGSADSSPRPPTKNGGKYYEVVLERWTIELGDGTGYSPEQLNEQLPNVYKRGVVLFRSLYSFLRFLPAWKLHKRLARQPGNKQGLRLKYRIRLGRDLPHGQRDTLFTPLCPSEVDSATTTTNSWTGSSDDEEQSHGHHAFDDLACPGGILRASVDYRRNQDFTAVDAEALLSSRFLGLDEGQPTLVTGRSLPHTRTQQVPASPQTRSKTQYGSAEASSSRIASTKTATARHPRALLGAYGSLSTFHATGKLRQPAS